MIVSLPFQIIASKIFFTSSIQLIEIFNLPARVNKTTKSNSWIGSSKERRIIPPLLSEIIENPLILGGTLISSLTIIKDTQKMLKMHSGTERIKFALLKKWSKKMIQSSKSLVKMYIHVRFSKQLSLDQHEKTL